MKPIRVKKHQAFSLLEAAIVFGISASVLFSLVGLVLNAIVSASILRDRVVATQLAQEALEMAHNLRDKAFLEVLNQTPGATKSFDSYLSFCSNQDCCLDYETNGSVGVCPNFPQKQLYLDGRGLYVESGNGNGVTATKFYRWLTANPEAVPADALNPGVLNMLRVTAFVKWEDNQIQLVEYLYNWLP